MHQKISLVILLVIIALAIVLFTNTTVTTLNESSRLLTARSLLVDGNFSLFEGLAADERIAVDVIYDGTAWYSDKPPLLPVLTAAFAFLIGDRLAFAEQFTVHPSLQYYLTALMFSGAPAIILLYLFYRSLELVSVPLVWRLVHTATLGFGTMVFPFATVYASHALNALALFASFYYLLRFRQRVGFSTRNALLSGLWMGFALTLDVATSASIVIGFLILWLCYARKGILLLIGLGLLPWGIMYMALNYATTGLPLLPWYAIYRAFLQLPENSTRVDLVVLTPWQTMLNYAKALFFDHRALLITSPITAYALWYMSAQLRRRAVYMREALAIALGSLLFFLILFGVTIDFGGATRVLRWMLPFVPLWFWFLAAFQPKRFVSTVSFGAVALTSIAFNMWFANDPWMSFHNVSLWRILADNFLL